MPPISPTLAAMPPITPQTFNDAPKSAMFNLASVEILHTLEYERLRNLIIIALSTWAGLSLLIILFKKVIGA